MNVGSGVADLVLLPIAQYKKDGRVVRGLQKGTNAFMKSTAMEAIKLGARLATGTQVILEQAETVLGGQFKDEVTAEAVQAPVAFDFEGELDEDTRELISKYAVQPGNVKAGVQSAYESLKRNLNSAAQTILAVPMEVYERSGNEVRLFVGAHDSCCLTMYPLGRCPRRCARSSDSGSQANDWRHGGREQDVARPPEHPRSQHPTGERGEVQAALDAFRDYSRFMTRCTSTRASVGSIPVHITGNISHSTYAYIT